jgi:hypothetical protein
MSYLSLGHLFVELLPFFVLTRTGKHKVLKFVHKAVVLFLIPWIIFSTVLKSVGFLCRSLWLWLWLWLLGEM